VTLANLVLCAKQGADEGIISSFDGTSSFTQLTQIASVEKDCK
jgi:hypothetical protein